MHRPPLVPHPRPRFNNYRKQFEANQPQKGGLHAKSEKETDRGYSALSPAVALHRPSPPVCKYW